VIANMRMRLLVSRKQSGYAQMAMDEAILESIIEKQSPETISFFDFYPPTITIGRLQNISEINLQRCRREGIVIVRRLTGGRAVIHSGDFTFPFIIRKDNPIFQGNVYETYKKIFSIFSRLLTHLVYRQNGRREIIKDQIIRGRLTFINHFVFRQLRDMN